MKYYHEELTDKIICCFYKVYNNLGYGFLEKVYENALNLELHEAGLSVSRQVAIQVNYKGTNVGDYFSDLIVENKVIVEVKAIQQVKRENEAQLLNYLKATQIEVGMLLNFGLKPEVRRRVFNNSRK